MVDILSGIPFNSRLRSLPLPLTLASFTTFRRSHLSAPMAIRETDANERVEPEPAAPWEAGHRATAAAMTRPSGMNDQPSRADA
jgi:hypothetical protein